MSRPVPDSRTGSRTESRFVRRLRPLEPVPATGAVGLAGSGVDAPAARPTASPLWEVVCQGVRTHGFHVLHIGQGCDCGDCDSRPEPPGRRYGYTIGLAEVGLPELFHRSPEAGVSGPRLAEVARYALSGVRLRAGDVMTIGGRDHLLRRLARPATVAPWAAARASTVPGSRLEVLELAPLPRRTGPAAAAGR